MLSKSCLSDDVDEIIAVSVDSDSQIPVFFRVKLGILQCLGRDDVELHAMPVGLEIGPNKMGEVAQSLLIGQKLGGELLVEQGSSAPRRPAPWTGETPSERGCEAFRPLEHGQDLPGFKP